jgi:hypothetical protein
MIDPISNPPVKTNTTTSPSTAVSPDRAKRFSDALVAATLSLPTTNHDLDNRHAIHWGRSPLGVLVSDEIVSTDDRRMAGASRAPASTLTRPAIQISGN